MILAGLLVVAVVAVALAAPNSSSSELVAALNDATAALWLLVGLAGAGFGALMLILVAVIEWPDEQDKLY